jgi:hypothetical protein
MTTLCEMGLLLEADFARVPYPMPEPRTLIPVVIRCGMLTADQEAELHLTARLQRLAVAKDRLATLVS